MPVNILCILGGPKRKGNADLLLDQAIAGAQAEGAQIDKIRVADLKISGCLACQGCARTGKCVVNDDMQQIYPKLLEADGLIVSTPIFFMGLPAQLKALIDRGQALWVRKYKLAPSPESPATKNRKGLLIAVGATDFPYTFDAAKLVIKSFFYTIDVQYSGELLFPGIEVSGSLADNPEALAKARCAGEELARALKQGN